MAKSSISARRRLKVLVADTKNLLFYGAHAPFVAQRIFVNPQQISKVYFPNLWSGELPQKIEPQSAQWGPLLGGRRASGKVIGGDWDRDVIPIEDCPKYQICMRHFVDGKSWEESGAYSMMRDVLKSIPNADGCRTEEDVAARYRKVDELYHAIKAEKELKTRKEVQRQAFRESGGVYVHVDRNGDVVFGGGGWHRLVISMLLGLESIPAQMGVVHTDAIHSWQKYRRANSKVVERASGRAKGGTA